ncbi:MAG TPA: hypothetical protein HA292_03185 [Candidatus Nitrosotenuis sp.]|jgi:hypothetical protein|nr:hypothetical protein [Candidatus Nitrosotenuis sp.]HIH46071.1 hypothetical protein [Candidatus Nitrosotenuis sp.]HIH68304.1 hypothetical protein [Candidatus Nitrosotenuis sp.]HII03672.1 hypothetical protein [Candidatus Nitrosotenuis sp.]
MRNDDRFEIERAYDILPHVIGASWASVWFRLNGIRKPTIEEFRSKTVEYFELVEEITDVFPIDEKFEQIRSYSRNRHNQEIEKIINGKNPEIEKRFKRYIDYG